MPRREPPVEDRCEARTQDAHSCHFGKLCPNLRAAVINGRQLCKRHAMQEALAMMVREGRAKPIIRWKAGTLAIIAPYVFHADRCAVSSEGNSK